MTTKFHLNKNYMVLDWQTGHLSTENGGVHQQEMERRYSVQIAQYILKHGVKLMGAAYHSPGTQSACFHTCAGKG